MNERIRQLAEQALNEYSATYHHEAKIPEAYLEKFAEVIVRECVKVIRADYVDYGTTAAVINIEKHFGVEE